MNENYFIAQIDTLPADTGWQWEYYIRDHLGNIRVSFADLNENGTIEVALYCHNEVLEENHYYPFGMKMVNYLLAIVNLELGRGVPF